MEDMIHSNLDTSAAQEILTDWLERFDQAVRQRDGDALYGLFQDDGYWRDFVACTWDIRTTSGAQAIADALLSVDAQNVPTGIKQRPMAKVHILDRPAPWQRSIETMITFETPQVKGIGYVKLVADEAGVWRAWTLLSSVDELKGFPELMGEHRLLGELHRQQVTWLERRVDEVEYIDRDPTVLVLGAGHSGLSIAARLQTLGVDTLVVEKNERVGDNWRNRYRSLNLHNEVWANHLPYMSFPPTWPIYCSKDKLGDWFETYAKTLDLNVWTATAMESAVYSPEAGRWTVVLKRGSGEIRTVHPTHLVLAIGVFGDARTIPLPGEERFNGTIITSKEYKSEADTKGRRVLVIGTGSSGHDIAQDFCLSGADVTMLQRSSTCVMDIDTTNSLTYGIYHEHGEPTSDADVMAASTPILLGAELHRATSKLMAVMDAELLDGLHRAGFRTDYGTDGTGFLMKYYRQGGGYYVNVGASNLIVEGKIKIKGGVEVAELDGDRVIFTDGSTMEVDTIVLAVGYANMQETVRKYLGDEVADAVGPVWGIREDGEVRGLYYPLDYPNLWIMGGSLVQCRLMSKTLAVQIKAREVGLDVRPARVSVGAEK
jgi:cation diffusion facilitator CzcD-associated flavoprotein CzcO